MIIVSQNKKNIYNFDNVKSIDILENEIYISDDILSDMGTCIAHYKTEERAKEVLQEIMKKYLEIKCFYNSKFEVMQAIEQPKVFEMPKE